MLALAKDSRLDGGMDCVGTDDGGVVVEDQRGWAVGRGAAEDGSGVRKCASRQLGEDEGEKVEDEVGGDGGDDGREEDVAWYAGRLSWVVFRVWPEWRG